MRGLGSVASSNGTGVPRGSSTSCSGRLPRRGIRGGDPIPPEMLNALQNPSYEKQPNEVGYLPLPTDYEARNQWKTFETTGTNQTCSLGTWNKNTVIRAKAAYDGTTATFPEKITVTSITMEGLIVFVPYLTTNKTCEVTYTVSGRSATATLVPGEIAVLYTETYDFAVPQIKRILSTQKCNVDVINISTKMLFDIGTHGTVTLEASYESSKKVLTLTADKLTIPGEVKADTLSVGESASGHASIDKDGENASVEFAARGTYDAEHMYYSTDTGSFLIGHAYQDTAEVCQIKKGRGRFHVQTGPAAENIVLIHQDISDTLNVVDDPGWVTLYSVRPPAGQFEQSTIRKKLKFHAEDGIRKYTYSAGSWVQDT